MPIQEQSSMRSESLREFISYRPGFLIRWGIVIFFFILAGLAIGSYFIHYPDIITSHAKINSINPPKQLISKHSGRLVTLFKSDNQEVQENDIIGYIESTANHSEVMRLSSMLDTLLSFSVNNQLEKIPAFWRSGDQYFSQLGELQQAHQTFMRDYVTFKDYLNTGFYTTKKQMLNRDLANTRRLLQALQQQKDLQQQDLAITIQNYNVHDTLHNEMLVNDLEYRNQLSQLINKKMTGPEMTSLIIGNQNQQNALLKEMLELDNQVSLQKATFLQALNAYRSVVDDWKQKHLLVAVVSGKLVFSGFLEENQQLQMNEVIGFITNPSNQYYVEMRVPQANFGKVQPGQKVLLKFPSYPSREFGSVVGRIEYIKSIPSDSGYLAKVSLPQGLLTNYNKIILFTEGLTAEAEIITANRRLSDRILKGF